MRDRAILSKLMTLRVSKQCTTGNFQTKFYSPQKWWPFRIFEFLPKIEKHKFASISLTMQDRVISSKFSIHRASQQSTLANFVQVLKQNSCFSLGGQLRMPMHPISSFQDGMF